ncbi:MAG: glycosyltransferase family 4 protein [Lutibacter sp.]|uniref:glycosyltransferase family 4 protein n=1 Tax=Lutibacter sp. TaxID=1925666 RepID=UPI00299ECF60|nr:glycosyltransferase family 4 protein [Lutibacter sp.]MDX1828797.1 glycosyltransferase family 4 protein [Lutibacter sp.]
MNKTLLIVVNVDWLFLAHRLEIAKEALGQGFKVTVVARDTGRKAEIENAGFQFINLNISRLGVNPFFEFKTVYELFKIYKTLQPAIVYQVTLKPVIYGTFIARFLKIKSVNAISGLGYNFTDKRRSYVQQIMLFFMRIGFNKKYNFLVFENEDDYKELDALKIINNKNNYRIIKGVGVNLVDFKHEDFVKKEKLIILFPARMLWDKGVREFVEAAKILQEKYFDKIYFKLCGMIDKGNIACVSENYLKQIEIENYLKWYGHQKDIKYFYKNADIVVLPSYREGLPTSLIEACAIGRPIITTNAIGCKECVDEGLNGYKVPVKSTIKLAKAIEKLIVSSKLRKAMGIRSRQKAEAEFDKKAVIKEHLKIFNEMI